MNKKLKIHTVHTRFGVTALKLAVAEVTKFCDAAMEIIHRVSVTATVAPERELDGCSDQDGVTCGSRRGEI